MVDMPENQTTTLGPSRPGSIASEGVLPILQSSWTGVLPSDCFMSYLGHMLE